MLRHHSVTPRPEQVPFGFILAFKHIVLQDPSVARGNDLTAGWDPNQHGLGRAVWLQRRARPGPSFGNTACGDSRRKINLSTVRGAASGFLFGELRYVFSTGFVGQVLIPNSIHAGQNPTAPVPRAMAPTTPAVHAPTVGIPPKMAAASSNTPTTIRIGPSTPPTLHVIAAPPPFLPIGYKVLSFSWMNIFALG